MSAAALSPTPAGAGFFGKLPGRGDFLRRDVAPGFVELWDGWLARALAESREAIGPDWTELFLTAPVWHFLVGAERGGGWAQAGVLCPSVDRVGRCYPLTVLAPLADGSGPATVDWGDWYRAAEDVAVAAVQDEIEPESFMGRVADLGLPRLPLAGEDRLLGAGDAADPAFLAPLVAPGGAGLWWTEGSEIVAPAALHCPEGLPAPARFAALLDGAWAEHGWPVDAAPLSEGLP